MRGSERAQLMYVQIVAFLTIAGVIVLAALLAHFGYAIPSALVGSLVSGAVGKWFGKPLWSITLHQVGELPPPLAAQVAKRAIASLPPNARAELAGAELVLEGLSDPPPPLPKGRA